MFKITNLLTGKTEKIITLDYTPQVEIKLLSILTSLAYPAKMEYCFTKGLIWYNK